MALLPESTDKERRNRAGQRVPMRCPETSKKPCNTNRPPHTRSTERSARSVPATNGQQLLETNPQAASANTGASQPASIVSHSQSLSGCSARLGLAELL